MKYLIYAIVLFFVSFSYAQNKSSGTIKVRKVSPDLIASISKKINGDITKSELLTNKGIQINDTTYKVVSFEVYYSVSGKGWVSVTQEGNQFSTTVKDDIQNFKGVYKIEIHKIRVKGKSGDLHQLAPLEFIVKANASVTLHELIDKFQLDSLSKDTILD